MSDDCPIPDSGLKTDIDWEDAEPYTSDPPEDVDEDRLERLQKHIRPKKSLDELPEDVPYTVGFYIEVPEYGRLRCHTPAQSTKTEAKELKKKLSEMENVYTQRIERA